MTLPLIATCVLVFLALGYRTYGRLVARQYSLGRTQDTPAHRHKDGIDFVPTQPFYLFGQHFSAIAAAGPIVGPIIAAQQFGWLPSLVWICVGVVFIGAVHDFTTLVASVRHDARSIAEVAKVNLGPRAWLAMLAFIWLALVYVIVAFVDVTATSFTSRAAETGIAMDFDQGGAVALAGVLYLALAIVMGLSDRFLKPPLWLSTIIFVPAIFACVWFGTQHSDWLAWGWLAWVIAILAYCFAASLSPMWILLQPRGYLGGFVLYAALLIGTLGIFVGGYTIEQPAVTSFDTGGPSGLMFPFLFVTIACGACSGFHGLVCSGTTSKQIDREQHCHPIGYGAMLLEAFVAVIALSTIMIVVPDKSMPGPGAVYARGIGSFVHTLTGMDKVAATTFGAMVLSTFIFDTLDSATRLGRYILQELFGRRDLVTGIVATLVTVLVPLAFLIVAGKGSYQLFWSLFGTSNQLLAGLSLLAITVWLKKQRRPYWYTLAPMVFVMAVTVTALVLQARALVEASVLTAPWINGLVSATLLGLATILVIYAVRAWKVADLERRPI